MIEFTNYEKYTSVFKNFFCKKIVNGTLKTFGQMSQIFANLLAKIKFDDD